MKHYFISLKYINDVVEFVIHDDKREMKAIYKGVVPSLFKEGQNVIIYGKFNRIHSILTKLCL